MIFANFASLDHNLAKMIKSRSTKSQTTASINPISVAIAYPLLGYLALCILLDSTYYSTQSPNSRRQSPNSASSSPTTASSSAAYLS